jgi:hypothetical protein
MRSTLHALNACANTVFNFCVKLQRVTHEWAEQHDINAVQLHRARSGRVLCNPDVKLRGSSARLPAVLR